MTTDEVWEMEWELNPTIDGRKSGVYIITPKGAKDILYVGMSGNLSGRIKAHPVYKRKQHDLHIRFIEDRREYLFLEYRLVFFLRPPLNNNLYGSRKNQRNYVEKEEEPREVSKPYADWSDPAFVAYMRDEYRKVFD